MRWRQPTGIIEPASKTLTSESPRPGNDVSALSAPGRHFEAGKTSRAVRCEPPASGEGGEHGKDHATRHTGQTRSRRFRQPRAGRTAAAAPHLKKVRAAIDAMVSGDCKKIKDAAEKVGLARESLSRALSTPHVAEHLRQKVLRHPPARSAASQCTSLS